MTTIDIQGCVNQILSDGYCLLRGHFPVDAVEACRQAFNPIADDYLAEHADNPNRGPHRHYIPLPFRPPLYNPAFFNDDTILAIASGILGEDLVLNNFASDTPFIGSVHQDIHTDLPLLYPEQPDLILPPHFLAVNWPFVDVTPERGPFQIAEGTHLLPKAKGLARTEAGEFPLKSLLMEVGDVMIRDPRCLHRGSPNLTSTPRVLAGFGLVRSWFYRPHTDRHPIARSFWETLTEREHYLLQRLTIDEGQ
ncbi:MAG: phytanoyl-CoA dioxygenase family protein [Caldilineaceae bacterium]|nr:phytanoyl-CoA dioxygenase family protein [Caldilineaceae bacterium]